MAKKGLKKNKGLQNVVRNPFIMVSGFAMYLNLIPAAIPHQLKPKMHKAFFGFELR